MNKKRVISAIALLFLLLGGALVFSLLFGAQKLSIAELLSSEQTFSKIILLQIRLPRTILALAAGILLAGSGAAFQLFFRNPLAEPGILGISGGASLGAVLGGWIGGEVVLAHVLSPINTGAFLGALGAGFLVTLLSGRRTGPSATTALLLCGAALGSLYSAFIAIILSARREQLHVMYIWMLGSFSGRGWTEVFFIAVPATLSVILLLWCGRQLDLLSLGEETALSLGVEVRKLRLLVMIAGAFACSAAVCAGGTIGFVGLIAPHIIRRILGAKARMLIPLSMLTGGILLLVSDTLARLVIAPSEIPVGTILTLLGAPFFISLIFSQRGLRNGQ